MNAPNGQRELSLPKPFSKFYDRLITLPERENSIPLDAAGIWQWLSTYARGVPEEKRAIFHERSRVTEPTSTDTFHDLCQILGITPVVGLTYYNTAKICRLTTADIWETMIRMAENPLKHLLRECGISGEFVTTDISKGRGSNVFKLQGALSALGIKSYVSFLPMTSVSDDYFDALEVGLPPRKPPKPKIPEKKDHVPQTHPRRQRAVPPRETPTRCSRVTQFENLIARIPRCPNNFTQTPLKPTDMFKGMLSLVSPSIPQDLSKDTRESIFIAVSNALKGEKRSVMATCIKLCNAFNLGAQVALSKGEQSISCAFTLSSIVTGIADLTKKKPTEILPDFHRICEKESNPYLQTRRPRPWDLCDEHGITATVTFTKAAASAIQEKPTQPPGP